MEESKKTKAAYIASRQELLSEESRNYSDRILTKIGEVSEKFSKSIDISVYARYKSEESFFKKLSAFFDRNKEKNFYDNIGYRLIVNNVDDDLEICGQKIIDVIRKIKELKDIKDINTNFSENNRFNEVINEFVKENHKISNYVKEMSTEELKRKNGVELTEGQLYEEKSKFLEQLYDEKNMKNDFMAFTITDYILEGSKNKVTPEIERVEGRKKHVVGGETGWYFANHDTIKSNFVKGYYAELQTTSYWKYKLSLTRGDHNLMEGKNIKIPNILPPEDHNQKDYDDKLSKYLKNLSSRMPENLVFQVVNGKSQIYKCSVLENYIIHFGQANKLNQTEQDYSIYEKNIEFLLQMEQEQEKQKAEQRKKQEKVNEFIESIKIDYKNNQVNYSEDVLELKEEKEKLELKEEICL